MKKLYSYLLMLCVGLIPLTFTACDDDDDYEIADTLDGIWHGSLGSYYTTVYGYGYDEWETEFRFYTSAGASSGEGVEVDYDPSAWSSYTYYPFKWNVAYGSIYLYYSNGDQLVIRNYSLTTNWLTGTLETIDGGDLVANLRLQHTDYWPWGISYAKATRASENADPHYGKARGLSAE